MVDGVTQYPDWYCKDDVFDGKQTYQNFHLKKHLKIEKVIVGVQ
jgi:hypothetical protein